MLFNNSCAYVSPCRVSRQQRHHFGRQLVSHCPCREMTAFSIFHDGQKLKAFWPWRMPWSIWRREFTHVLDHHRANVMSYRSQQTRHRVVVISRKAR